VRTEAEVRALLAELDELYETTADMDAEAEAVNETLLWLTGNRSTDDVRAYFTEG
jgi:hypothetical protein